MNRTQRREAARLLLAMRSVYPGDIDGALYRDARELSPKLPPPVNATVSFVDEESSQ